MTLLLAPVLSAIWYGWRPSLSSTDSFTCSLSGGSWHIAVSKELEEKSPLFLPETCSSAQLLEEQLYDLARTFPGHPRDSGAFLHQLGLSPEMPQDLSVTPTMEWESLHFTSFSLPYVYPGSICETCFYASNPPAPQPIGRCNSNWCPGWRMFMPQFQRLWTASLETNANTGNNLHKIEKDKAGSEKSHHKLFIHKQKIPAGR